MEQWSTSTAALNIEPKYLTWLTEPEVLSKALRMHCSQLTVQVLQQTFGTPFESERYLLGHNEHNSWIREVYLCGNGVPWIFARTVASQNTYAKFQNQLDSLGEGLLGENFLYQQPHILRTGFTYTVLNENPTRRSVFHLADAQFIVTESFLTPIPNMNLG